MHEKRRCFLFQAPISLLNIFLHILLGVLIDLFPWARDFYVVSRYLTQSSSRFLYLDISTGAYQVYRVSSGNAEMPGHLKRPRTSELWWVPNEGLLDSGVSFLVSGSSA